MISKLLPTRDDDDNECDGDDGGGGRVVVEVVVILAALVSRRRSRGSTSSLQGIAHLEPHKKSKGDSFATPCLTMY